MSAKCLDLVDIGDLKRDDRKDRDAGNFRNVVHGEAVSRHYVPEVQSETDQRDQQSFDQTHGSGEHDRRISRLEILRGDEQRRGRKRARRRGFRGRHCLDCGRCRASCIKDRAVFGTGHC